MRITEGMAGRQTLRNMRTGGAKVYRSQGIVGSQKAITRPSDSPEDTVRAMRLRSRLAALAQYSTNTEDAAARLETVDNSLQSVEEMLRRLSELAAGSVNPARTSDDMKATAAEVTAISDHLVSVANTQSEGRYVFSGDSPWMVPFEVDATGAMAYKGNGARLELQIDTGLRVPVGFVGSDVFMDAAGGGASDMFKLVSGFVQDLQSGNTQALQGYVGSFDAAISHVMGFRVAAGASAAKLVEDEGLSARLEADGASAKELLSQLEEVDFEEAVTQLAAQEAVYQAALSISARAASRRTLVDYLR